MKFDLPSIDRVEQLTTIKNYAVKAKLTLNTVLSRFLVKHRRKTTLAAISVVIILLNSVLFAYSVLQREEIFSVQYMSLLHSINSAATYNDTNIYFANTYPDGSTRAFEALAADDLGYTFVLTTLVRIGAIQLSAQVKSFITGPEYYLCGNFEPSLGPTDFVNRRYDPIVEEIIASIWPVAFYTFFAAVTLLSIILLTLYSNIGVIKIFLTNLLLIQLPNVAPSLFFSRLHSHSLIATTILLGVAAYFLVRSVPRFKTAHASILAVIAGLLIGIGDQFRHADGLIVLIVIIGVTVASAQFWRRRILFTGLVIMGYLSVGWYFDGLRADRNATLEITGASTQQASHPFGHIGLVGIRDHQNSLGVSSMEDIADAVADYAGKSVQMGQPEYHAAAQDLFIEYLSSHPIEYISILMAKSVPIANYAAQRLIPQHFSTDFKQLLSKRLWQFLCIFLVTVAIVGNSEKRSIALSIGIAIGGCFVSGLLAGPYYSFGITVLLYLSILGGLVLLLETLQHYLQFRGTD